MHDTLKQYFGYTTFRPLQENIIQDILDKKDVFALMPTGGGKSLCYQLPSIMLKGTTIVISPLISLMKDQVDGLLQNGIKAAYLNSSLMPQEQQHVITQLKHNELKLLYIAPERLVQDQFLQVLPTLSLNFFAIDEAHCISQWGHDFRPEYRQLDVIRQMFPAIPIIALTATATPRVKEDIIDRLHLTNASVYQASFNRTNLLYRIIPKQDAFTQLYEYISSRNGESGIIYCQSRKKVETIAKKLQARGINALPYHAGLSDTMRKDHQEQFIKDDAEVIVATIAFGMGIDKPNVRYIIHYDLPKSIEGYYQETGRAGRDGLSSECIFLYSLADIFFYDRIIKEKQTEEERRVAKKHLQYVLDYAQSSICRRTFLLEYFSEKYEQQNCSLCDNCLEPKETFDATILTQQILSCVYRVQQRFGSTHITNILVGSKGEKVTLYNHQHLSTFGIVKEYSANLLKLFISELVQKGYLEQTQDRYAILKLTSKSKAVLQGKEKVYLTKREEKVTAKVKVSFDGPVNQDLFQRLRILRKQLADKKHLPPYVIFSDATLKEMASFLPQTKEDFAKVKGVGVQKLQIYADIFLKEIASFHHSERYK